MEIGSKVEPLYLPLQWSTLLCMSLFDCSRFGSAFSNEEEHHSHQESEEDRQQQNSKVGVSR